MTFNIALMVFLRKIHAFHLNVITFIEQNKYGFFLIYGLLEMLFFANNDSIITKTKKRSYYLYNIYNSNLYFFLNPMELKTN